jgi:CxxC motif-containing protein (DUF1111 family)
MVLAGVMLALSVWVQAAEKQTKAPAQKEAAAISGKEIFMREWIPGDPRSHGGDGLGPVFNDSSCVACHNQGGAGGGGASSKNVNIVSATFNQPIQQFQQPQPGLGEMLFRSVLGLNTQPRPVRELSKAQLEKRRQALVEEVTRIHPGFRTASSVVIHHSGLDDSYESWKQNLISANDVFFGGMQNQVMFHEAEMTRLVAVERAAAAEVAVGEVAQAVTEPTPIVEFDREQGRMRLHQARSRVNPVVFSSATQHGSFAVATSQRNATALFGAGLIDAIPEKVLEEAAKKTHKDFPEVTGRVAKLPDGKIGRFGWKAQKATLRDFTVTACAVELGLHVPEHPQSGNPNNPEYKPAGYDLTRQECDALVDYLRDLPAPEMRKAAHPDEGKYLDEGKALFAAAGCAACHTEDLGEAKGIYSDLLVHDMGPDLGDTGSYGVFLPDSPGGDDGSPVPPITKLTQPINPQPAFFGQLAAKPEEPQTIVGATQLEWRTPPLWGVRDSAPYLHDGRAKTLEEAIAMHGGESQTSAMNYFSLKPEEQRKVIFFMKSLEAPSDAVAER